MCFNTRNSGYTTRFMPNELIFFVRATGMRPSGPGLVVSSYSNAKSSMFSKFQARIISLLTWSSSFMKNMRANKKSLTILGNSCKEFIVSPFSLTLL